MKRKITLMLVVVIAAAFYFGYLKFKAPSMNQIEKALPVQVDTGKEQQLVEIKDKTKNAISAATKELKKPDQTSNTK